MEKSVSNCFAQDSMLLIDPSDKLDALDLRLGALLLDKNVVWFYQSADQKPQAFKLYCYTSHPKYVFRLGVTCHVSWVKTLTPLDKRNSLTP